MSGPAIIPERCRQSQAPLLADALTQDQMERLLRAFIQDKTAILEDDALTLVKWAQAMRMGVVMLDMVLAGDLIPSVKEGVVYVELPDSGGYAQ